MTQKEYAIIVKIWYDPDDYASDIDPIGFIKEELECLSDAACKSGYDLNFELLKNEAIDQAFSFQFPLFGIFPCIICRTRLRLRQRLSLSIPFIWDFSMHRSAVKQATATARSSFNSLYLGFFHASHASVHAVKLALELLCYFQFPLFGIFPCIRRLFWLRLSITAVLI